MGNQQTFLGYYEQIRAIGRFVLEGAEQAGFDEKTQLQIELACDEAATNIIQHAYGGEGNGSLTVGWQQTDNDFVITLFDQGKSFDPMSVPVPEMSADIPIEEVSVGGLGIHFMRTIMDTVAYEFNPAGNTLTMTKRLPSDNQPAPIPITQTELSATAVLLTINGRIDQDLTPELEAELKQVAGKREIIIDLNNVSYVNSGGLRVLITAWRVAKKQGGDVVLFGLNEDLKTIFAMVGFDKIIRIFADQDAAVAHFAQS